MIFLKEHQECHFMIQSISLSIKSIHKRQELLSTPSKRLSKTEQQSTPKELMRQLSINKPTTPVAGVKTEVKPKAFLSGQKESSGKILEYFPLLESKEMGGPIDSDNKNNNNNNNTKKGLKKVASSKSSSINRVESRNLEGNENYNRFSIGNHQISSISQKSRDSERSKAISQKASASSTKINEIINKHISSAKCQIINDGLVNETNQSQNPPNLESCTSVFDYFNLSLESPQIVNNSSTNCSGQLSSIASQQGSHVGQRKMMRLSSFFTDILNSDGENDSNRKSPSKKKTSKKKVCEPFDDIQSENEEERKEQALINNNCLASQRKKTSSHLWSQRGQEEDRDYFVLKKRKMNDGLEGCLFENSEVKVVFSKKNCEKSADADMEESEQMPNNSSMSLGIERKLRRLKKKKELQRSPHQSQEDSCPICLGKKSLTKLKLY